ncbi:homoserine O-acetyltransferase MetA [Halanaerobacter jeridensis]|uniref:Homoserine O-acetyltransferase n=1 Tax=Halanaerobacter jeridensis TaxID=706427 RepID=A0A938XTS5_9FIRM|nr:homoserine O-succinyltransferase [Halanaerobacter jeridensis]MBM7555422.1 homoserine O-succinyltransferase [Halanaerobacter jeridensis]
MPIKVPDNLPAVETLEDENIFVMKESRAYHQDIRALKIVILNLMPLKEITETQLLRLLGNTPLQVDVVLLQPDSYTPQNISEEHLSAFYKTIDEVQNQKFDGMIITGAPVEHLPFEEVKYWEELQRIMDWAENNVTSTLHLCWAAQAGLYHHFGVPKYDLEQKMFGVFAHQVNKEKRKLMRGLNDQHFMPHSRYTEVRREDIEQIDSLEILSESEEAGVNMVATKNGKHIFITGHPEYDRDMLNQEYQRDLEKGIDINKPKNYFPDDDPEQDPLVNWRSCSYLLFSNWLNYYVYQVTPYRLNKIK